MESKQAQTLDLNIKIYRNMNKLNNKCNGWQIRVFLNWNYILLLLLRILDITSTVFLYCLIWIIMGWVTFIIILSALLCISLFIRYYSEEHYLPYLFCTMSTIILFPMATYQYISQLIYLILMTVWITVDFECTTCPLYEDRHSIIFDNNSLYAMFIICWILRCTFICWFGLIDSENHIIYDCNSKSFGFFDTKIDSNYNLQKQWYCGNYDYYNTSNSQTMLMKAAELGKIIIFHQLLQKSIVLFNDVDDYNNNILDFVLKQSPTDCNYYDEWKSYLLEIYNKNPNLKSNKSGRNIFLCACYIGDRQCIDKLIELEAEIVNSTDNDGLNGYTISAMGKQYDICRFLKDNYGILGIKGIHRPFNGDYYKILILGTMPSGKSSFFRNIKNIHGGGFEESEFLESKHVARSNMVMGILTLLQKSGYIAEEEKEYGIDLENEEIVTSIRHILSYNSESFENDNIDQDELKLLAEDINFIWNLDAIQKTYNNRADPFILKNKTFCFFHNYDYFMNKIYDVFSSDYQVTMEDLLKIRIRTTGLIENRYKIKDNKYQIFDVGGARNERKKWIHTFEQVDAIIFIVSLTSIVEVLFEDESFNSMKESIRLWTEIIHSKWFKLTKIFLILNKQDLYQKLIEEKGLKIAKYLKNSFDEDDVESFSTNDKLFYSKYTLLSHGYIRDIENKYNYNLYNNDCKYLSKDVMQLIDLYLNAYLDAIYDKSIDYIKNKFIQCNNDQNKLIEIYVSSVINREEVEKIMWEIQKQISYDYY